MALIKVTNGVNSITVTNGAYETIYKNQGFYPVEEIKEDKEWEKEESEENENEKSEDDIFVEELLEKPISEWGKDEVKRFAELKEIDISETKNAGQAKELISKWLEENDK